MFYYMFGKYMGIFFVKMKSDDGEEEVYFEKFGNVGKYWNFFELNFDLKLGLKVNVDYGE